MAEQFGEAVNLDAIIARRPKNRVARVGIELEGGWDLIRHPLPFKVVRDGSVFKKRDAGDLQREGLPGIACGEVPLPPMQPAQIPRSIRKYYPTVIDDSCGLHVHMSFETVLHYAILADSASYMETMIAYLRRWAKDHDLPKDHPLWDRLDGKSQYCQKKFWPEAQIQTNQKDHDLERFGHRYTWIHFCWGRYKTVECRGLTMMETPDLAISAVQEVVKVTNAYLLKAEKVRARATGTVPKIGSKTKITLELRGGEVYEQYEEE
jgi:hypothetical protein